MKLIRYVGKISIQRRMALIAALLLVATPLTSGCPPCYSGIVRPFEKEDFESDTVPIKRDIFMSRGWGAGGGPASTSRKNTDFSKRPRVLVNDDYDAPEVVPEPRTAFLRALPPSFPGATGASRHRSRPSYFPQLFISSGWGPLGK